MTPYNGVVVFVAEFVKNFDIGTTPVQSLDDFRYMKSCVRALASSP